MDQPNKKWMLAIGLVVVALGVMAFSMIKSNQDPTVPSESAPAGAYPTKLDDGEVSVSSHGQAGGGH